MCLEGVRRATPIVPRAKLILEDDYLVVAQHIMGVRSVLISVGGHKVQLLRNTFKVGHVGEVKSNICQAE